jgi:hypothetical protein
MSNYRETDYFRRQQEKLRRERLKDTTIPDPKIPDEPTLELGDIYYAMRVQLHKLEEFIAVFDEGKSWTFSGEELKQLDHAVVLAKTGVKKIKRILKKRGLAAPTKVVKKVVKNHPEIVSFSTELH